MKQPEEVKGVADNDFSKLDIHTTFPTVTRGFENLLHEIVSEIQLHNLQWFLLIFGLDLGVVGFRKGEAALRNGELHHGGLVSIWVMASTERANVVCRLGQWREEVGVHLRAARPSSG